MLTLETLPSFTVGLPLDDLPKTFKDAIQVSRKLGLEYLWIDALCIIQRQEGSEDWLIESSHMRSVYGGTHINLAASSATNVFEGLFLKPTHHNGGFRARVTAGDQCRIQDFHSRSTYQESSTETQLATRAWAFQEKLLAARTIHFGDQGVFWECRSCVKSEFLPDGFRRLGSHLVCPEDKAWRWSDIVSHYSAARLTYSSDRLPALSGIAARQHEVTGDQYLAGMWRKHLSFQLAWSCTPDQRSKRPPWRAPTWSWASVDGQTRIMDYHDGKGHREALKTYVCVLDVWTVPSGPDPFGAVNGGALSIGCSALIPARLVGLYEPLLRIPGSEIESVLVDTETRPFPVTLDCLEDELFRSDDFIYLLPLFGGRSGSALKRRMKDSEDSEQGEGEGEGWIKQLIISGVVLQRLGNISGHFRRVGYFWFANYKFSRGDDDDYHYDSFIRVIEEVGTSTAEAQCSRVLSGSDSPDSRYVLTIE